jgi:hypothetical protein
LLPSFVFILRFFPLLYSLLNIQTFTAGQESKFYSSASRSGIVKSPHSLHTLSSKVYHFTGKMQFSTFALAALSIGCAFGKPQVLCLFEARLTITSTNKPSNCPYRNRRQRKRLPLILAQQYHCREG